MPYAPVAATIKLVSILSLPAEALSVVFHYLNDDQERRVVDAGNFTSLPSGTRFPHNVAQVCHGWKSVAETVPSFWECIMLFLDDFGVHKDLERQFRLSRDHSIKVFVIRRNYPEEKNDLREHLVVDGIVHQLANHVKRCRVIVFDVLHSTSIPRVNSFSGTSKELITLRIRCRRGPAGPDVRHRLPPATLEPFICPNLRYIDLQGRTFIEATKIPQWLRSVRRLPGKALSISDLTLEEAGDYDLRAFITSLACMGHLASLKLSNINIDVGDYAASIQGHSRRCRAPATIHVQNFEFSGLSGEFIQAFFMAYDNKFDVSRLAITQCGLRKVNGLEAWELSIRDCHATEQELINFLEGWNGFSLELSNVTGGVTDRLFERLTASKRNHCGKRLFAIPTLRMLSITSETPLPLSPDVLKEMVFARKEEADRYLDIPSTAHFLPLFSVIVIPSTMKISHEDRILLTDALEEFYWAGPKGEKESEQDRVGIDTHIEPDRGSGLPLSSRNVTPQIKEEPVPDQQVMISRSDSPVLDSDCAEWDFSQFDDSHIAALISLTAASQTAATFGTIKLDPTKEPSRSPSPFVKDDYCDMDWSSLNLP